MDTLFLEELKTTIKKREAESITDEARFWMESLIHYIEGDKDKVLEVCSYMETLIEKNGYPVGKAWALVILAWIELKEGNNEEARRFFSEAIEIFNEWGDRKGSARSLNGIGVVNLYSSLFDNALQNFKDARTIAETENWTEMEAVVDSNLGLVYLELADYAEAEKRLLQAKSMNNMHPNNIVVIDCHLATAYSEMKRFHDAEKLLKDAKEKCYEHDFKITLIDVLGRYGKLLEKENEYIEAEKMFEEALKTARIIGNQRLSCEYGIEYGKNLAKLGKTEKAKEILNDAEIIAIDNNLPGLHAKALKYLAEIEAEACNWKEAYEAIKEGSLVESKLFSDKVIGQASSARAERISSETQAYKSQLRRLVYIGDIGRAIAGAIDTETIGRILYSHLKVLIPITTFGLALYNEKNQTLNFCFSIENDKKIDSCIFPITSEDSLSAYCARTGKDIHINDLEKEYKTYIKELRVGGVKETPPMKSLLFCPVKINKKVIAIITVQNIKINLYEAHHIEILRAISAYVAVALENARLFLEVKTAAGTDPLTGVLNRRRFMEVFQQETDRVMRYASALSFVIFDLDHFKLVNDTYGHATGDLVLKKASSIAGSALRSTDYIARYGGEEFVLLLPNTNEAGAVIVAERVRKFFSDCILESLDARELKFSASFGISVFAEGDNFDSLSARADKALYKAKDTGRNKVITEHDIF